MSEIDVRPEQIAVGQVWQSGDGFKRRITNIVAGDVYFDGIRPDGKVLPGRFPIGTITAIINGDREELIEGELAATEQQEGDRLDSTKAPAPAKAPAGQKPAIGRVLHYHPSNDETTNEPQMGNKGQPYAATITHVWGDDCVNIRIDQDASHLIPSEQLLATSVRITKTPEPGCCTWPARV